MENTINTNNSLFNVSDLYVGNLCWFLNESDLDKIEELKLNGQKYIFQKITETEYKEIFTGILTTKWPTLSEVKTTPCILNLEPITNYVSDFKFQERVDKPELLAALNMITFATNYKTSQNNTQKK